MHKGEPIIPASQSLYPSPSAATLQLQYVGRQVVDVPAPAAVIDAAVVRRNCKAMLETVDVLGLGFRAHVKTHKTVEMAKLQVGEGTRPVKLVCSTVAEIESMVPWLLECKSQGRSVNVLYGFPLVISQAPRLARLVQLLGPETIGLFVDHPRHIEVLDEVSEAVWPGLIPVWISIDVGYHRDGVTVGSDELVSIATGLKASKRLKLAGLYSHYGSSYESRSPEMALKYMETELLGLEQGAQAFLKSLGSTADTSERSKKPILSLGATPTAAAFQNLLCGTSAAQRYLDILQSIQESFAVELHAGVYPVLDLQQLATRARPRNGSRRMTYSDIGFRVLAEVASLYPDRGDKAEALIAAGSIVLGREPCKSYAGWAVVTPWPSTSGSFYDPDGSRTGWIVGRISQEHGILTWEGPQDDFRALQIGEKIMLWPNHACIAGVNFGYYLVVDSDTPDPDMIQHVWIRSRGW